MADDDKDGADQLQILDGEAPEIYANLVHVSLGPYDVTLDFGYQSPEDRIPREQGDPRVGRRVVRVTMSHPHAKSMIPILAKVIAHLETAAGTIPTPGFDDLAKE